ncbi:MAG: hypothetical protein E7463_15535, partial [Ruminococcaceae bacterium]|nr:hypothetical protein [Oscillospiraceae bacterium]
MKKAPPRAPLQKLSNKEYDISIKFFEVGCGAVASVGFIPTFAAAHPVLHHAMVQNREIPQEFVARFPDFLP